MEIVSTGRAEEPFDYKEELKKYEDVELGDYIRHLNDEEEMLDMLMTKEIRDYHKEIGFELTDEMLACLIVYTDDITFGYMLDGLKMIYDRCRDDKTKEQIGEYIDYLVCSYKSFFHDDGSVLALYCSFLTEDLHFCGLFKRMEDIYPYMSKWGERYRVLKTHPISKEDFEKLDEDMDCCVPDTIGGAWFDKDGFLEYVYTDSVPEPEYDRQDSCFCRYYAIPNPFKTGDLVINTAYGDKGIARHVMSFEEEKKYAEEHDLDYSDMLHSLYYEGIREDDFFGDFTYDHVNPLLVRHVTEEDWKNETEKFTYQILQSVFKGEGYLFTLEWQLPTYRKFCRKEKILKEREKTKKLQEYTMMEINARENNYQEHLKKQDVVMVDDYEEYLKNKYPEYDMDIYQYAEKEDYSEDILMDDFLSESLKAYHKRIGYELPIERKITILEYEDEIGRPFFKLMKAFEQLKNSTDSEYAKKYLTKSMIHKEYCLRAFIYNRGSESIYTLFTLWDGKDISANYQENGMFREFSDAMTMARRTHKKCMIIKTEAYETFEAIPEYDKSLGASYKNVKKRIFIDKEGRITSVYSGGIIYAKIDIENEFKDSGCPFMPHPFRRGDFVSFDDDGTERLGVVFNAPDEAEDENDYELLKSRKYQDYYLEVSYLNPDYMKDDIKIYSKRIYPWKLEKLEYEDVPYEVDTESAVLHALSDLTTRYGDVWQLECIIRDMIKKNEEDELFREETE